VARKRRGYPKKWLNSNSRSGTEDSVKPAPARLARLPHPIQALKDDPGLENHQRAADKPDELVSRTARVRRGEDISFIDAACLDNHGAASSAQG
jgi:hypothetical protein